MPPEISVGDRDKVRDHTDKHARQRGSGEYSNIQSIIADACANSPVVLGSASASALTYLVYSVSHICCSNYVRGQ